MAGKRKIIAIVIIFFLVFPRALFAQQAPKTFLAGDFKIEELTRYFGKYKKLIDGYQLPILIALSYYPELRDSRISFRFRSMNSAGLTTFTFGSFFNSNRHFLVTINDDEKKTGVTFKNVPLNAQVGLIGHELAHVLKFLDMTNAGIALWALSYLSHNNHKQIEKFTDETEIRHGLGWQLYEWTSLILSSASTTARYKKMKQTYYMSPQEIIQFMSRDN